MTLELLPPVCNDMLFLYSSLVDLRDLCLIVSCDIIHDLLDVISRGTCESDYLVE